MGGSIYVRRRKGEMDAEVVRAILVRAFPDEFAGDDDDREDLEWEWEGERVQALWSLYYGERGVKSVGFSPSDRDRDGPIEPFRRELPEAIAPLREIVAAAPGARLYVDGGDLTRASVSEVIDALGGNHTPAGYHRDMRAGHPAPEAGARLAQWLAGREPALARLRELAPVELDLSRDSLVAVWQWAVPRLRFTPIAVPIVPAVQAPMWYSFPNARPTFPAHDWWTGESLELWNSLLYYVGECVRGGQWEPGHRYNQGMPVLIAGEKVLDPKQLALELINQLQSGRATPYDLLDACDVATMRGKTKRAPQAPPEDFLARYVAGGEPRLEWLRRRSGLGLDPGPDTLTPLWTWAMEELLPRPDRELIDLQRVPMWYRYIGAPPWAWSHDSLDLIDGLAHHLAACLLRAVPGAGWELDRHMPALSGLKHPVSPITTVVSLAGPVYRKLRPDVYTNQPPTPDDLRHAFDQALP